MNKNEILMLCEKVHEDFKQIKEFSWFPKPNIMFNVNVDAMNAFGQCRRNRNHNNVEIRIYKTHYEHGKVEDVINTIVHELCHAYDYKYSHHGQHWKYMAKIAGRHFNTVITRCSAFDEDEIALRKTKAIATLTCKSCAKQYLLMRRTRAFNSQGKGFRCGRCKGDLNFVSLI